LNDEHKLCSYSVDWNYLVLYYVNSPLSTCYNTKGPVTLQPQIHGCFQMGDLPIRSRPSQN